MRVRWSADSDIGLRREVNQDSFGTERIADGYLLVVCDGMGGHAAGEVASQIGVKTIIDTLREQPTSPADEALTHAFTLANHHIYAEGRGTMGTTGVAALIRENVLHIANVGDSRAYLIRDGQIEQISRDHSFVYDQVAAGLITPEQARTSNIRNIITRALGHIAEVEVDIFRLTLKAGDTILLSSDGMHGALEDAEIAEHASMLTPEQAVKRMIEISNERGGVDNITVVVATVEELDPAATPPDEGIKQLRRKALPQTAPLEDRGDTQPNLVATPPAAPEAAERPLNRTGATISAVVLAGLLAVGGYALSNPAPAAAPAPTATAAPQATTTSVPQPSVAPTKAPAATAKPSAAATTAPTIAATATTRRTSTPTAVPPSATATATP